MGQTIWLCSQSEKDGMEWVGSLDMDSGELRVLQHECKSPRDTGKEMREGFWEKDRHGRNSWGHWNSEWEPGPGGNRAANVSTRLCSVLLWTLCSGRHRKTWHQAPPSPTQIMLVHYLPSLLDCELFEQLRCVRFIFVSTTLKIPGTQQGFNDC